MNATIYRVKAGMMLLLLGLPFFLQGQKIDSSKSKVEFSVSNMGIFTVNGTMSGMHGDVVFDAGNPEGASFDVCIRPETIDTDNSRRDRHLRSEDFFHVEKYPEVCIVSERISRTSEGFLMTGYLSIKDTKKEISVPFNFRDGVFTGDFTLNRHDFDLGTDASGSFAIGDEVEVLITAHRSK